VDYGVAVTMVGGVDRHEEGAQPLLDLAIRPRRRTPTPEPAAPAGDAVDEDLAWLLDDRAGGNEDDANGDGFLDDLLGSHTNDGRADNKSGGSVAETRADVLDLL